MTIVMVLDICGLTACRVASVNPKVNAGVAMLVQMMSTVELTSKQLYGLMAELSQSIVIRIYSLVCRSMLVLNESKYREGEFSVLGYNITYDVGTTPLRLR